MAVYYDSCGLYIQSFTDLAGKINAIDAIIDALINQGIATAGNQGIAEYQLNDGQTIIKQIYRDSASLSRAIADYERIKQIYVNRMNGRVFRAIDGKNFINGFGN